MMEVLYMEYGKVQQKINDVVGDNVKKLAQLFPSAVKDGEVDFEALKEELGQFTEVDSEKYELTWAGKKNAKKIAQEDIVGKTLKFIPEDSKNADTTENLYIEGDNLEVLKLLRQNYYGAVKMIYIDPPYNTGNDFVYNDIFLMEQSESELLEGNIDELGIRFTVNNKSKNRYHANWMNMMYTRLKISKDLLKDNGCIFISIDENEVQNMRKICDEIFGEKNLVSQLGWQKVYAPKNQAKYFSNDYEFILCYAKNINDFNIGTLPRTAEMNARYKNLDDDPRGDWKAGDCVGNGVRSQGYYDVIGPTGKVFNVPQGKHWVYAQETMKQLIEDNRIWFGKDGSSFPAVKQFLCEVGGRKASSLLTFGDYGHTDMAKKDIIRLFPDLEKVPFDTPKPVKLIKMLCILGSGKDDIILDYFAGSATTAQAVMELNLEEKSNRKFILVQLAESLKSNQGAENLGIRTISDVARERIRRAGDKIRQENPEVDIDIGFRVFHVADTNIKWNSLMDVGQLDLLQIETTPDIVDFMPEANDIDIIYELMLRQRDVALSETMEQLSDIGKRTYLYASSYLVCLETEITVEIVNKLAEIDPLPIKFIFRDSAFKDDIALKDETFRRLKALIEKNAGNSKVTYTVEFI